MKLYDYGRAPNPRRVRIFLAEKGLEIPKTAIDIATRENLGPDYRSKNPLGYVPALELDDGTVICESMAICRYLEELHPEPNLFGRTALEKALVEQWSRHAELELYWPIAHAFRNTNAFWAGRIPQVPEFGEVSREQAIERLAFFDGALRDRPYLAGDRFTVADITGYVALDFGRVANVRVGDDHPNLKRWYEEIGARPSARL